MPLAVCRWQGRQGRAVGIMIITSLRFQGTLAGLVRATESAYTRRMNLWDHQRRSVAWIEGRFRSGVRRVLLVAPTGSGKTRTFLEIAKRRKTLVLVPWAALVDQTVHFAAELGIDARVIRGSKNPSDGRVHVTTVQTAVKRDLGRYDLVVVDEARGVVTSRWEPLVDKYESALMLGCDATPHRLDGRALSEVFQDLYEATTVRELTAIGKLAPCTIYAPTTPVDVASMRWSAKKRDWSAKSAAKVMARRPIVGDAIEHWRRHGQGRKTFIYCCTREHAQEVAEAWCKAGIETKVMDGNTGRTARAALFEDLSAGRIKAIANIAVLTEGVDYPELACSVVLRPTASRVLWLQVLGRGLRVAPGKRDLVVLDHADNTRRHGFPDDDHDWTLEGRPNPTPKELAEQAPKAIRCPRCGALMKPGEPCAACGGAALAPSPSVIPGTLTKIERGLRLIGF